MYTKHSEAVKGIEFHEKLRSYVDGPVGFLYNQEKISRMEKEVFMQNWRGISIVAGLIALGIASSAQAWGTLTLKDSEGGGTVTQNQFDSACRELGLASAVIPLAPSEPLGLTGVDVGLGFSVVDIRDEEEFWKAAAERNPSPVFILPQIIVRKGIPCGIDLGVSYTPVVIGNDYSLVGAEAKWSFLEGSMLTPALAVRLDYHRLIGTDDLTLQTTCGDISISKGFGPITPYTGIGMVFIFAHPDAPEYCDPHSFDQCSPEALEPAELRELKGYAGVRLTLGCIQVNPEIDLARDFLIYSLKFGILL